MSLPSIPDTASWAEAKATPDGRRIAADGDAACHKLFIPFDREGGQS